MPDRSLPKLGATVRLRRNMGRPAKMVRGLCGVIVVDLAGRCKDGQIAVLFPSAKNYTCVPLDALEYVR